MTVALIGVGADQTNSRPYPQVYDDGSFEYVPIPEAFESTETNTFGSIRQNPGGGHLQGAKESEGSLADVLTEIQPQEGDGEVIRGSDLKSHQIHWDPNFSALTYGEVKTKNKNKIQQLDPTQNDTIAFYTGLTSPDSGTPHRYIIGHFTVSQITDFKRLLPDDPPTDDDDRVVVSELKPGTRDTIESFLEKHSTNAHAKRYLKSGTIHPNLLIVAGEQPGGLLKTAYPLSKTVPGGHAFTETAEQDLNVASTASHRETGFLGGFKKAHRLELSGREFLDLISENTEA